MRRYSHLILVADKFVRQLGATRGARLLRAHKMPQCPALLPSSVPFLWSNATGDPPPATFRSAWVSPDGMIVEKHGCRAVRNGGCAKHMYKQWAQPNAATAHARVVTLATHFGDGHYHFPMEALTALASSGAAFEPFSTNSVFLET